MLQRSSCCWKWEPIRMPRMGGGHPPLYSVSNQCGHPAGAEVVRTLVRAGAKVNAHSGVKRVTALHMAARRGNIEIARALLECGAKPDAVDSQGVSPMQRAINCRKREFVAAMAARR